MRELWQANANTAKKEEGEKLGIEQAYCWSQTSRQTQVKRRKTHNIDWQKWSFTGIIGGNRKTIREERNGQG